MNSADKKWQAAVVLLLYSVLFQGIEVLDGIRKTLLIILFNFEARFFGHKYTTDMLIYHAKWLFVFEVNAAMYHYVESLHFILHVYIFT